MGRSGALGAGSLLSGAPGDLLTQSSAVLRWPGTDRDVAYGWAGQPDNHGLAEAFPWVPALLHLRRRRWNPAVSRRHRGTASGAGLRTIPRDDPGGGRVPLTLSPLRGAHGVSHRRMRRTDSFARPVPQRAGPRDRPCQDDGKLWQRGIAPSPGVQAGGARPPTVSPRVSLLRPRGEQDVRAGASGAPSFLCRVPAGPLAPLWPSRFGADPT